MSVIAAVARPPQGSTRSLVLLAGGLLLAVAAPKLAPSSAVLPAPGSTVELAAASAVLAGALLFGLLAPRPGLYALVTLAVLEGAVRKWVVNDITVFLVKDFVALGVYAAVLPTLSRREWRRSPWVIAPLAALLALAVVSSAASDSLSQAVIGLRAYAIYVPLIWVAPKLLDSARRVGALLLLVLALGLFESILVTLQVLAGGAWLNRPGAGVIPAVVVVDGVTLIRPTGTMLQVNTLATFLIFPVLVAFALVMRHRRGPLLAAGLVSISVLTWGILFTGSRGLFATVTLAGAALMLYLLWHRRLLALVAVPAAVVAGYLSITFQPWLGVGDETVTRVPYSYIDVEGKIHRGETPIGGASARSAGGLIQSRDEGERQEDEAFSRVRNQLRLLGDQSVVGHGTGKFALGSQYLLPERDEAGESAYVRVAYELGLLGLGLFVLMLAAVWVVAAWSAFVALEWRRPAAVVALGAATLVPLITLLSFAFDYPIVAIVYYALAGLTTAWAGERVPTPTARAGLPATASAAPSPTRP